MAIAADVVAAVADPALESVGDGGPVVAARTGAATALRRLVTLRRDDAASAASALIEQLVVDGRLARDGEMVRPPGSVPAAPDPTLAAAMDRLEAALAVPAPPPLATAAGVAGCAPEGIRALERAARIVVLEPDLAYAMSTYQDLASTALRLSTREPLTPAAFRDATGTSRKYVMAILEDLDRRAILRRTPAGHVPGPKAPPRAQGAAST